MDTTITGTAAGVPFTALPPEGSADGRAALLVTWHMLDAPRSDAAFAAALRMTGVPAWRVHLGMPMCGARMVDGRLDAILQLARRDPLTAYLAPFARQAAGELPAAVAALRDRFPVDDGPVGLLGGSLGGTAALLALTEGRVPVAAAALVNPAVRVRSVVGLVQRFMAGSDEEYRWTEGARRSADELDFVARAGDVVGEPPLLLVSGEQDHPALRTDAAELVEALRSRYATSDDVKLRTVSGLGHPLAEEPASQTPAAAAVDRILTGWFRRRLVGRP